MRWGSSANENAADAGVTPTKSGAHTEHCTRTGRNSWSAVPLYAVASYLQQPVRVGRAAADRSRVLQPDFVQSCRTGGLRWATANHNAKKADLAVLGCPKVAVDTMSNLLRAEERSSLG